MTIDSKLEKADDVIEQFWTGKGLNVKAGQKLEGYDIAWYDLHSKDTAFRDALVRKLSDQGFFGSYQLEKASLMSCKTNRDEATKAATLHEFELMMQYVGGNKRIRYGRYEMITGAEFNRNADGTFNLKLFPKQRTADGSKLRLVASQNPVKDEVFEQEVKQLAKDFHLMYWLLQETGYLAKEE